MFKNILVAFDGSSHSYQAAKFSADLLKAFPGGNCTVITVLTFTSEEARFLGASDQEFESARKYFAEKYFAELQRYFQKAGVPFNTVIKQGDPVKEIIKYAGENNVDHIVLGPRGLGNIKGALLGSVSGKIIHLAKCPVTLIKDQY
ncbi:MAG: universal stress protein [Bacillota bacterium]